MNDAVEIVGIDPSITELGIFTIDPATGFYLRSAISKKSKKSNTKINQSARAYSIVKQSYEFISQVPGNRIIAIEGPAYAAGKYGHRSIEQLARVRQACYDMAAFYFDDFLFYEIAPSTAKRAATGKGNADKELVRRYVNQEFELNLTNTNVTDAAAIALAARAKWREELTKERERA